MLTVGYGCAGMAVALVIYSIWSAGVAGESGMAPLLLALSLLLVAMMTLRTNKSKV